MEKVNHKIVGCPLSQRQYEGMLRRGIEEYAPEMSEGGYLRMALIYFDQQARVRGVARILAEVLEAMVAQEARSDSA